MTFIKAFKLALKELEEEGVLTKGAIYKRKELKELVLTLQNLSPDLEQRIRQEASFESLLRRTVSYKVLLKGGQGCYIYNGLERMESRKRYGKKRVDGQIGLYTYGQKLREVRALSCNLDDKSRLAIQGECEKAEEAMEDLLEKIREILTPSVS